MRSSPGTWSSTTTATLVIKLGRKRKDLLTHVTSKAVDWFDFAIKAQLDTQESIELKEHPRGCREYRMVRVLVVGTQMLLIGKSMVLKGNRKDSGQQYTPTVAPYKMYCPQFSASFLTPFLLY